MLVKNIMQEGTVTSELRKKLLEHTQITSVDKTNISGNVEKGAEN